MKTYREIVYSIIEGLSGFNVTDDSRLDEQLVARKVDDVRATLIKQQYERDGHVEDLFYQMCKVQIAEVTDTVKDDLGGDQQTMQFEVTFPELLPNVGWCNVKYLGRKDYKRQYNRRSLNGLLSSPGRYYSREESDYTILSTNKALISNEKKEKEIVAIALFKSPMDVPGYTWDHGYPVPDPFKLEMIVKQDLQSGLGIKADNKNDSQHNLDENQQQTRR